MKLHHKVRRCDEGDANTSVPSYEEMGCMRVFILRSGILYKIGLAKVRDASIHPMRKCQA